MNWIDKGKKKKELTLIRIRVVSHATFHDFAADF